MKYVYRCIISLILLSSAISAYGDDLLMVRSQQAFPEAMLTLQTSIIDHGYIVTRVQRVDIGLNSKGYKTDKYRRGFFR